MFRKLSCIQICKKVHTQNFRHVTDFLRPPHIYAVTDCHYQCRHWVWVYAINQDLPGNKLSIRKSLNQGLNFSFTRSLKESLGQSAKHCVMRPKDARVESMYGLQAKQVGSDLIEKAYPLIGRVAEEVAGLLLSWLTANRKGNITYDWQHYDQYSVNNLTFKLHLCELPAWLFAQQTQVH